MTPEKSTKPSQPQEKNTGTPRGPAAIPGGGQQFARGGEGPPFGVGDDGEGRAARHRKEGLGRGRGGGGTNGHSKFPNPITPSNCLQTAPRGWGAWCSGEAETVCGTLCGTPCPLCVFRKNLTENKYKFKFPALLILLLFNKKLFNI